VFLANTSDFKYKYANELFVRRAFRTVHKRVKSSLDILILAFRDKGKESDRTTTVALNGSKDSYLIQWIMWYRGVCFQSGHISIKGKFSNSDIELLAAIIESHSTVSRIILYIWIAAL